MHADLARPDGLIFDLDGTLVDTAGDLIATLNAVLADEGLAPLVPETAIPMVGHGSRVLEGLAAAD